MYERSSDTNKWNNNKNKYKKNLGQDQNESDYKKI